MSFQKMREKSGKKCDGLIVGTYSAADAAEYLGLSIKSIYDYTAKGRLAMCGKVYRNRNKSKSARFTKEELDRYKRESLRKK